MARGARWLAVAPRGGWRQDWLVSDTHNTHRPKPPPRLDVGEALELFSPERFHEAGRRANAERERRHGDRVFYNKNRHLNSGNECVYGCRFCAYSAPPGDPRAWSLSLDEALRVLREEVPADVTELHIVGGAHPERGLLFFEELLRELKRERPDLHLKAFSAVEVVHMAELDGLSVRATLERLREAGLDSLPGGGAEIFADRVRREICPNKATAEQWLDCHRQAHGLGIRSNATILHGHIETPAERVDHLLRLRDLQDETGGFQAIIPLKFHPENSQMSDLPLSGGLLDLQVVAACRLVLDNFYHVKAYWPSLGLKVAQLALSWGADDLDGTVTAEKIYNASGAQAPKGLDEAALRALIREAGRRPVERDSLYNVIEAKESTSSRG